MKVILRYVKRGSMRFLSNLETLKAVERNLRRAKVDMIFTSGFHPMPKISYLDSMATGVVNRALYMSLEVREWNEKVFESLKQTALRGLDPMDFWLDDLDINSTVSGYSFSLILEEKALRVFPSGETIVEKGRRKRRYELKDLVEKLKVKRLKNFILVEYTLKKENLFSPWSLVNSIVKGDGIFIPVCEEALVSDEGFSSFLSKRRDGEWQSS